MFTRFISLLYTSMIILHPRRSDNHTCYMTNSVNYRGIGTRIFATGQHFCHKTWRHRPPTIRVRILGYSHKTESQLRLSKFHQNTPRFKHFKSNHTYHERTMNKITRCRNLLDTRNICAFRIISCLSMSIN